jgi:beta-glucosidase
LFGDENPSGKLTVSFPKNVGQCPIYYNYFRTGRPKRKPDGVYEAYTSNYLDCGNLPLFFFGEGLSYTEFVYESMTLDRNELDENGAITVSVTVKNAGERDGKEVVQLYLRDLISEAVRPVQELLDFKKIFLKAGESKTVTFKITEPQLRYHNFNCEYVSEKGDFTVSVGYADHMKFTEKFTLV